MKKGFTLIEAITAIFLLTVGIVGIAGLINQQIVFSRLSSQRLVPAYLAQEGIEIIRNIRDTNLLEGKNWDSGLAAGSWQADYNDQSLSPYTGVFLNIESASGLYGYDSGKPRIFQRKIIIAKPQDDILEIRVQIFWQEKGRSHQLTVQENLYNWR